MSNLPPLDLHLLATVIGGASTSTKTANAPGSSLSTSGSDDLVKTLTTLSDTIKDIGNAANKSGFSTTEILMLGLLLNQSRHPVGVFVRPAYW